VLEALLRIEKRIVIKKKIIQEEEDR